MTALDTSTEQTVGADVDFDTRIRPLIGPLTAYFARRVIPADDAPDCVSEALVVLWRRRDELPADDSELRAYSYGVARGILANHRRGHARRTALLDRAREATTIVRAPLPGELTAVRHALGRLSSDDRELLTLLAWDGLSLDETARALGISPPAARQRLKRARDRLRALLDG